ncbi:hypothetical protein [Domibacillus mangrovi]|uniref:Minor capsid protein n=1 Tax=Domibacillus mangrovi TaxID=1714354 RepID=A0A1Q5P482_9BACI|nr:hypothetical protein [Domibacillus mangrovi]OKL36993.1 hypothetical protein BLL40_05220 [Domibacillus mangrovi]
MIQKYLKDVLAPLFPRLQWTMDYRQADDHTGTVYSEGGRAPDKYETGIRRPSYMIYIRSSDFAYAEQVACDVVDTLHRTANVLVTIEEKDEYENVVGSKAYRVLFMSAVSEPNRIGVIEGVMEWSANFDVTLREEK